MEPVHAQQSQKSRSLDLPGEFRGGRRLSVTSIQNVTTATNLFNRSHLTTFGHAGVAEDHQSPPNQHAFRIGICYLFLFDHVVARSPQRIMAAARLTKNECLTAVVLAQCYSCSLTHSFVEVEVLSHTTSIDIVCMWGESNSAQHRGHQRRGASKFRRFSQPTSQSSTVEVRQRL